MNLSTHIKGFRRYAFIGLTLLVLMSMVSCNLPFARATEVVVETPTSIPQPTAVKQNLPPAVIETIPVPQSTIPLNGGFQLVFNQKMERQSVEGALQMEPSLGGHFEWQDDQRVTFTPDQALSPAVKVRLTLKATALAANGLALPETLTFDFQTAETLSLTQKLPEGSEIDPTSAVVAAFNQPVVPLGAEAAGLPAAFTLEPDADGAGEWLNTSTYIFYPRVALEGGKTYTVRVNTALVSTAGTAFQTGESLDWSFTTVLPRILEISPSDGLPIPLDNEFIVRFNQPMDQPATEAAFSLTGDGGTPVTGSFKWNETGSEMTYTADPLLPRNIAHYLTINAGAAGAGGTPLENPQQMGFVTVPELNYLSSQFDEFQSLQTYSGYAGFNITFTAPLEQKQAFDEIVTISPEVSGFVVSAYDDYLYLGGYFEPSTDYTLSISTGLVDAWGGALAAPVTLTFKTEPLPAAIVVPITRVAGSTLVLMPWDQSILAQVNNVQRISVSRALLTVEDFIIGTGSVGMLDLFNPDSTWSQAVGGDLNQQQSVAMRLSSAGGGLAPGLYGFRYEAPEITDVYLSARFYAVVSRVQITIKKSSSQIFVWAVNLEDQTPIAQLPITIFDNAAQSLGQVTTGQDGTATLELEGALEAYATFFAVSSEPGDDLFGVASTDMSFGMNPWQLGVDADYSLSAMKTYLYTDRPIYRPGQTLFLRGVLRYPENGRYLSALDAPNPLETVQLKLSGYTYDGSDSGWQQELTLPVSEYSTFSAGVELPANLPPGYYSIQATSLEGWQSIGFQVAEYRKPEIELTVAFEQTEVLGGTPLQASADARYYFGAKAANLPVEWALYKARDDFYLPGYRVGKSEWDWQAYSTVYVLGGTGVTDGQGIFKAAIPESDYLSLIDPEALTSLTLEVTIRDESGLPVSARASVLRHPATFYAGIRADAWSGSAGKEMGFDILTVNWEKKSSANHTLAANFLKAEWVEAEPDIFSGSTTYKRVTSLVSSTSFTTDASGKARVAFTPAEPGVYVLEVRGDNALTEYTLWVTGSGVADWPRLPDDRLELQTDAESYQPGDAAVINIPNPFDGEALALVTIERGKVLRSETLVIRDSVFAYSLPMGVEDAPNVYVSIILLASSSNGVPQFRYGVVKIEVDRSDLLLNVALTPQPEKTTPGGEVAYQLEVKDADGNPVEAEFSLAVVDKALLALSDANSQPIEDSFYGIQPLGVQTSTSLAVYVKRVERAPVELGRGGGGGDGSIPSSGIREDFQDTAYWSGVVTTNTLGLAEVRVPMPDNLTTWVAEVRGLDKEMRVGSAAADVIVSKDLLVRPVTPRFAVVGDHLELASIIHNNTDRTLDVQASLQASGFILDDAAVQTQNLALAAGEHARVSWWGTVESVDELDLVFNARADSYSDSTRPVWGKLPVLHYASPQTFGTSGILPDAGQRLEVVSLPNSYTPTGGHLDVELTPSLAAVLLGELDALEAYDYDYSEAILSRLLPNIETYRILKDAGIDSPELESRLGTAIQDGIGRLEGMQNSDGGWSWLKDERTQVWITAYVVFGLSRAQQAGLMISQDVLDRGRSYLETSQNPLTEKSTDEEINTAAFVGLALQESGSNVDADNLWAHYERMSPSTAAMLALVLNSSEPGSVRVGTLVSNLQAGAIRSATGAHWEDATGEGWTYRTANYTTAVVVSALAQIDPASTVLPDAVRHLIAHRKAVRGWGSTYETAWVLLGLGQYMRGTGDLRPAYDYTAVLNGSQIASGMVTGAETVTPVQTRVPLADLLADSPNGLVFSRNAGNGSLFYRAFLQVDRPVEEAEPLNRGVSVSREYFMYAEDCKMPDCTPVRSVSMSAADTQVLARVTITLPHEMYYLVVEDNIPAGMEVVDLSLKTTEQGSEEGPYLFSNPYARGWRWWWFYGPRIYDERVHWSAQYLAAGTYELTYRMIPVAAGEFRTLPARAWDFYFPEVEGSSAGTIFSVMP